MIEFISSLVNISLFVFKSLFLSFIQAYCPLNFFIQIKNIFKDALQL